MPRAFWFLLVASAVAASAIARDAVVATRMPDATVVYARADSIELKLDLYFPSVRHARADSSEAPGAAAATPPDARPDSLARAPFVLWLHGGGWRGGSRADPCPALPLTDSGFVVASADYRFSTRASWPAQVHDAKAAWRWLWARADSLMLDTARAVAWGTSAGGHLAAVLGLSSPSDSLEEMVGAGGSEVSSPVRAVVMFHAPTDFLEYHPRRWRQGSSVTQLLGCRVPDCPVRARRASPAAYVTTDDPPVFIAHGTADSIVPVTQAWRMHAALRAAGVSSELAIVEGAGHGGPDFVSDDMMARVSAFLARAFAPH